MASLSGQPHDTPKMWIECGVTLLERRGALLESRFYDQRHMGTKPSHITRWLSVEANNKEYTKALHYWTFVMEIYLWPVDSPHKGPVYALGIRDLPCQHRFFP